jgi:nitroreductase
MGKISEIFGSKSSYEGKKADELTEKEIKCMIKDFEKLKEQNNEKILECFKTRRSIRKFAPDKKVPFKDICSIVEAGMGAPAASNIQNYRFIFIEKRDRMLEVGNRFNQQCWLADASCLLIVLREDYHLNEMFPETGKKLSIQNVAAVIENILMAVHVLGYGACWIAGNDNKLLKEFLGIPDNFYLDASNVSFFIFGFSSAKPIGITASK